ncbi:hypothetical protein U1Q18_028621 [Sarracenia purpurea var. burkii]
MEDENGLELSLGLPWCRSSAKSKDKSENLLDTRMDEGDRSNKLINDFKNFLEGGTRKLESGMGSQRSEPIRPDDSFCNNFSNNAADADASKNLSGRGLWVANDNRGAEIDEEKKLVEAANKRKNLFDEISNQKKRERESHNTNLHDKSRLSHISVNTDDGSTAENEDVADSEVDGSTSKLVSKELHTVIDSSVVNLQPQNKFTVSSDKEFKVGNMSYGVPFPANMVNIPYSLAGKDSSSVGLPSTVGYPLPGMMNAITPAANSVRPGTQNVMMPGNLPLMFGYYPVQLPVLDKDNSRGLASHPQQLPPSYVGRILPNSDKQNDGSKTSQAGMTLEPAKGDSKQYAAEGGSDNLRAEGFPSEFAAIRPGIAADLNFGGCGSYPNLPWVSTKGPGPNGRTISGVTYRYSTNQIKIVCACHSSHMSPEEFVRHAGEDQTNPDSGPVLTSLPGNNNPAASAQS